MKTTYTGWGKAIYSKNYKKLMNFVKTKKGKEFVSKLHTERLEELANQFGCKFVLFFKNNTKNYKLIQKACDDNNIIIVKTHVYPTIKPNIIDYTHVTLPKNLTKDEIKAIDSQRSKSKLGKDDRFRRLENYKMDKWEKKHPRPSEKQLQGDLFPKELLAGWQALRDNRQESIRNWIILKYCKDYHPVIARYESFPQKYKETIVGYVRDTRNEINKLYGFAGDIDDNPLDIVCKAYNIIEPFMKDKNFVCGKLISRDGTHERFLVPGINKYKPERYNVSATIYQKGTLQIAA